MKVIFGIQARSFSKRLPGKIYMQVNGTSILNKIYTTCQEASTILNKLHHGNEFYPYVLGYKGDDKLMNYCVEHSMYSYIANTPSHDLVRRYLELMRDKDADVLVRITSDCPVLPTNLLVTAMGIFLKSNYDYFSNTIIRTYPDGYDVQIASMKCLEWYSKRCREKFYLEHPFSGIDMNLSWRNKFLKDGLKIGYLLNRENPIFIKLSVDTENDLKFINEWIQYGLAKTSGSNPSAEQPRDQ